MPIRIRNAKAIPYQIPDNKTTDVEITFDGMASNNDVKVIVDFKISPYPELNCKGNERVSAPYVFNEESGKFSKIIKITNANPVSQEWLHGYIALKATDIETGNVYYDYAAIVYQ